MNRARIAQRLLSNNLAESARLIRESMGGRNEYGEYVEGTITQTDITIVTAPLSGEERAILPEGLREIETRKFWLREDIEVIDDDHIGDKIEYLGKEYRMVSVDQWGDRYVEALGKFPAS